MTAPASLLVHIRTLERYAAAGGAPDAFLAEIVAPLVLLVVGVPLSALGPYTRVLALIRSGCTVTLACRRVGLSRRRYYQLREVCTIPAHEACDARGNSPGGLMPRTMKTAPITAPDTLTPPQQANGKPTWQAPQTPRADGGMSTGKTGGNFDAGSAPPNSTPADLLAKEGTGSV